MPERYSKSIKVLVREFAKNVDLDVILSEALSVLPETELLKPVCNLLHCGHPTDLALSALDRQDKRSTTRASFCSAFTT